MTLALTAADISQARGKPAKLYWYADLLDDLKQPDLQRLVIEASFSSQALAADAVKLVTTIILDHLQRQPRPLYITYRDGKNRLYRREFRPAADLGELRMNLLGALQRLCVEHQRMLVTSIALDEQWTREFLASAVAQALASTARPQTPKEASREMVYAPYPFLDTRPPDLHVRLFGKARSTSIKFKAILALQTPARRDALNEALDEVIADAPPGRHKIWTNALSAVYAKSHPLVLAEALGFSLDEAGRNRAAVTLTRMGRRFHDRYFMILCHLRLMTPVIAEFMALEYRVPREVVREGMHSIRMANSRAVFYAPPRAGSKSQEEKLLLQSPRNQGQEGNNDNYR